MMVNLLRIDIKTIALIEKGRMMKIAVNGVEQVVEFEPDTPLLWVIRDELKLKGTKFGCGKGLCGACTVHMNGHPIRSCITPVSAVENQNIEQRPRA